jgi:hypothetical protein
MTRTEAVAAATVPESGATAGEPKEAGVPGDGPASTERERAAEIAGEDIAQEDKARVVRKVEGRKRMRQPRLAAESKYSARGHKEAQRYTSKTPSGSPSWLRDTLPSAQGEHPPHAPR